MSASNSGLSMSQRADPFSFLSANCGFYAECPEGEIWSLTQVQPTIPKPKHKKRSSATSRESRMSIASPPTSSVLTIHLDMLISCVIEDNEKTYKKEETVTVRGWCSLSHIGPRNSYPRGESLSQPGFHSGKDRLYGFGLYLPVYTSVPRYTSEFDESFPPLSGASSVKKTEPLYNTLEAQLACIKATKRELRKHWPEETHDMKMWPMSDGTADSATTSTVPQASSSQSNRHAHRHSDRIEDVMIGLEYESMEGLRFIASPRQFSENQNRDPFSVFITKDVPIFLPSPGKKSEGNHLSPGVKHEKLCQLQRIFFVTPSSPASFATRPCIQFRFPSHSQRTPVLSRFHLKTPVILPPSSICVLRLPFVYGIPSQWTGQLGIEGLVDTVSREASCWTPFLQTTPTQPYDAHVERNTLLFPV